MKPNFRKSSADYIPVVSVLLVFVILLILSWNSPYFWDNVQQTSKEAHWFYMNGFSEMFLPSFGEHPEIVSTGYHPPLMGIMTASLWFLLGKKLWVSHLFIGMVAIFLAFQTFQLFKRFFPEKVYRWPAMLILLEPTLLAQIYIASPDVILLTAFVVAVRAIVDQKKIILMTALPFLMLINGRGMLIGGLLFVFSVLYSFVVNKQKNSIRLWLNEIAPFVPTAILLFTYFGLYLYSNGWFFKHSDSPWVEGWKAHDNLTGVMNNFLAFGLRLIENGRFMIWFMMIYLLVRMWRAKLLKKIFEPTNIALGVLISMIFLLFLYFALTTKIVILSRYYMPMFFVVCVLVFRWVYILWNGKGVKIFALAAGLFFITGNFWVYPEKVATAWDATLAHIPFYKLKAQSIEFLRQENVDFNKVSGGFGFTGYQKYFDLSDDELYISNDVNNKYFIYSNISNAPDDIIDQFNDENKWKKLKSFKKGRVFVSVLKNIQND